MTRCNDTGFISCEPEDICKNVTSCVNCGRQMHYYKGIWYNWDNWPAKADDTDFGQELKLVIKNKPGAEG